MFDRLVLSAVLGTAGFNGFFPDPPTPLTTQQLIHKAKEASVSQVCEQKKKSKELKKLCERWEKHE